MSGHEEQFVTFGHRIAAAVVLAVAFALPGRAQDLPPPSERPVLTVDGPLRVVNAADRAVFDLPMLRLMPQVTYRTSTVWTKGVLEFTGVPLRALLDSLGAGDAVAVSARAINDYRVEIPATAITDEAPIVAYRIGGTDLSRRQKGPLWVIFPYDADERYRTHVTYAQSIWQLDRLTVKK